MPIHSITFYCFVFLVQFKGLEDGISQTAIYIHISVYFYLPIYIYIYLIFSSIYMPVYPLSTYLSSPSPSRSNTAEYLNLDVSAALL